MDKMTNMEKYLEAIKAVALAGKIGVSKEIMHGLRLKRTEAFYAYGGLEKYLEVSEAMKGVKCTKGGIDENT